MKPKGKFERLNFLKILYCKFKINQINKQLRAYEQKSLRFDERRDFIHEAQKEEKENGETGISHS